MQVLGHLLHGAVGTAQCALLFLGQREGVRIVQTREVQEQLEDIGRGALPSSSSGSEGPFHVPSAQKTMFFAMFPPRELPQLSSSLSQYR